MRCSLILFMYIALVRTLTRATLYILVYGMKIVMLLKVRIFFMRVLIKAKLEYLKSVWKHGSTRYTLFFFLREYRPSLEYYPLSCMYVCMYVHFMMDIVCRAHHTKISTHIKIRCWAFHLLEKNSTPGWLIYMFF